MESTLGQEEHMTQEGVAIEGETSSTAMTTEVGHESAHKAGMPQLDPTTFASQLFWLLISSVVLYVILSRSVLPRIDSVLERRRTRKEQDLRVAATLRSEAESAKSDYEKLYAQAKLDSSQVVASTEVELRKHEEAQLANIDAQLAKKIELAEQSVREATQQASERLAAVTADITAQVVKAVAGKEPTGAQVSAALSSVK
jgi:F-type H+-transporting ATPase subunit b